MCWSILASSVFAFLYLVAIVIFYIEKSKFYKCYVTFSIFYMIMEIFQTLQWFLGDVSPTEINQCSFTNRFFTYVAYILIWSQPLLYSYIGYLSNQNISIFKKLNYLNVLVLFFAVTLLFQNNDNLILVSHDSNLSNVTCTSIGETDHLVWRFKMSNVDMQPNNFTYLILCIFSFLLYERELSYIGYGWTLSFIFTTLALKPTNLEIPSTWCLMSVIANPLLLAVTLLQK